MSQVMDHVWWGLKKKTYPWGEYRSQSNGRRLYPTFYFINVG